jgi:hypothetical protein
MWDLNSFVKWFICNVYIIILGIAFRCFAYAWLKRQDSSTSFAQYVIPFVTHHSHSNDALYECSLLMNHNLAAPSDICDVNIGYVAIVSYKFLHESLSSEGIFALSSCVQILSFYLATQACSLRHDLEEASAMFTMYWINPFIIMQSCVSIFGTSYHLILILLLYSVQIRSHKTLNILLLYLILYDYKFLSLLPIVFLSVLSMSYLKTIILSLLAGMISLSLQRMRTTTFTSLIYSSTFCQYYFPGTGILWYVQAQKFGEFSSYFMELFKYQPFLYSAPISIRLVDYPNISVIDHSECAFKYANKTFCSCY